jgi:hypothetical protein
MIRFLLRFIGLICLAVAFILLIYDGTKSIAGNRLFLTSVRSLWELINAASLAKLEPTIQSYVGGYLWDPIMVSLLASPSWGVLGVLGILFLLLGRKKKPLIGYARS